MNFLQFLSTIAVAIVSTFGLVQIKKMDRKNTHQHGLAAAERSESELKLMGKLDGIHEDVQDTANRVGKLDGKLDAHIADRNVHDVRLAKTAQKAKEDIIEHGDEAWASVGSELDRPSSRPSTSDRSPTSIPNEAA